MRGCVLHLGAKEPPKAIIQICHGMCEYTERYENEGFVGKMLKAASPSAAADHPGHGNTAKDDGELGYFTDYNDAVDTFSHQPYHAQKIPFAALYPARSQHGLVYAPEIHFGLSDSIDGVVICGTSGSKLPLKAGLMLTRLTMTFSRKRFAQKC